MTFKHSAVIRIDHDTPRYDYTITMTPVEDFFHPESRLYEVTDGGESMTFDSDMLIEMARAILRQRGVTMFEV
jgi:hypothetical protein